MAKSGSRKQSDAANARRIGRFGLPSALAEAKSFNQLGGALEVAGSGVEIGVDVAFVDAASPPITDAACASFATFADDATTGTPAPTQPNPTVAIGSPV